MEYLHEKTLALTDPDGMVHYGTLTMKAYPVFVKAKRLLVYYGYIETNDAINAEVMKNLRNATLFMHLYTLVYVICNTQVPSEEDIHLLNTMQPSEITNAFFEKAIEIVAANAINLPMRHSMTEIEQLVQNIPHFDIFINLVILCSYEELGYIRLPREPREERTEHRNNLNFN